MGQNNKKQKNQAAPVESHKTAAWSNIEKTKNLSKVAEPSNMQTGNAKGYVDDNEK
jgi:hypothetical protein